MFTTYYDSNRLYFYFYYYAHRSTIRTHVGCFDNYGLLSVFNVQSLIIPIKWCTKESAHLFSINIFDTPFLHAQI